MPKKKHKETQAEQSARFEAEVQRRLADGSLNPTEAEEALDLLVKRRSRTTDLPICDNGGGEI